MRNVDSGLAGHAGAERTRRLLPAATPRAMLGHGAKRRMIAQSSPMHWRGVRSPMPNENVSNQYCHRSNRGRVGGGTTIARC